MTAPTLLAPKSKHELIDGKRQDGSRQDRIPMIAAPLSHGSNSNAAGRRREDDENLVAFALRSDPGGTGQGHNTNYVAGPLGGGNDGIGRRSEDDPNLVTDNAVRRLTPTECCRLQGFPDDWLGAPNEPPDSPRYAALGDAVTVNVAFWIGRRILEAEEAMTAPRHRKGFMSDSRQERAGT